MRGDGTRVLVVGAGIAGLAAARTLREWGASVEILEQAPGPPREGTGIYLPGNAVRALDRLGLGEPVSRTAVRIRRQHTSDHRGRALFDIETDELWAGVAPCLALPRAALHQVLLGGADGIPIRWGSGPEAIAVADAGVSVSVDGDRTGYDLVLGADGVHSTVRRLALGPGGVRPVGQLARRFVVPGDPAPATWSVRLGPGSAFLTIPIGDGRTYCYVDGDAADERPLRELLAGYADPVPALLDALDAEEARETVHAGLVEEVVLDSWSRGGVLLIGDAAHATSPNLAQGAAMAIEDALVLAESLAAAETRAEAVADFGRRRRPRTDWVRDQTHRRDRARGLHPAVRNPVLRRFGARIVRGNYRPLLDPP